MFEVDISRNIEKFKKNDPGSGYAPLGAVFKTLTTPLGGVIHHSLLTPNKVNMCTKFEFPSIIRSDSNNNDAT